MFKLLIFVIIIGYVLIKVGNLFFRAGAASQQYRNQQQQRPNVNNNPKKPKSGIKGGEYVDYEEVK